MAWTLMISPTVLHSDNIQSIINICAFVCAKECTENSKEVLFQKATFTNMQAQIR